MHKVLFVCHGNICRSPMAEFVFKDIVEKNGKITEYEISSSATSTEEIYMGVGNYIYPPTKQILLRKSIGKTKYTDFYSKRAKQITIDEYNYYDYIICMDHNNLYNLKRLLNCDMKKVSLLLDYTISKGSDIADPWYSGDFETCYKEVSYGCTELFKYLERK